MNAARNHDTGELRVVDHRLDELEKDRDEARKEATERWVRIDQTLASIDKHLALGAQRMDAIDTHLEATDKAHLALEKKVDERSGLGLPHALGGGGMLVALAAWVERLWNSTPTPPHH